MRRLWYVMWKELLELRQDPRLFGIIFFAPVVQLTMLGYAATTDVKNVPLVIVDQDRSPASRELISRFDASPYFSIAGTVSSVREVDPWLERGRAWLALNIPADYHQQIDSGRPATVQVIADGTDSSSTGVAMGYAATLVGAYNEELVRKRMMAAGTAAAPPAAIEARIRVWFNPELESRYFMIPGIVALLLLVITTNLSSMAVVREKELGTLEQLNVTPVTRWQLIVGKLVPYGAIGIIDVLLVTTVAVFWFKVPLLGSPLLLLFTSCIYLLTTLGLGLFISTISSTQQQAMMTATFFVMTPMMYLSGFIFPIENMPAVIQPFTYLIPLRYFIVIVRGIFLKGVGWHVLWPQIAALATWGVVIVGLAVARSRKTLN
jgi:ABC-2 type transport system permease protein